MEEMKTGAVATTESVFGGTSSAEQTVSMPEPANVFGFAPEEPEAAAPEETDRQDDRGDANTGGQEAAEVAAAPAFQNGRKRDAFADQRRALEQKYRNDPARVIGERILKDRMQRDGTDRRAAYEAVMQKLDGATDASTAEELDVTPGMARYMREMRESVDGLRERLGMREDTEEPQYADGQYAEEPASYEERAQGIVQDLMQVPVPKGFDMDAAIGDPAFVDLLTEYPAAAAVRIYQAEHMAPQQVADRLRARQGVPASTRPQQAVRPEPNYRDMSSEEFFKLKERVMKNIY